MKKNKSKLTAHDKKVVNAHLRNEYLLRVRKLLIEMGMGSSYPKFSPLVLNYIYLSRGQFMRLLADEKNPVPSGELKKMQMVMYDWCKNIRVLIDGTDYQMRLIDFYEIWYSLIFTVKVLKNSDDNYILDQRLNVWEAFEQFLDFDNECFLNQILSAQDSLKSILSLFAVIGSSIPDQIYWLELNEVTDNLDSRMRQNVTIHMVDVQTINFKIGNNSRPAFRVGIPIANVGIEWLKLAPIVWGSSIENADMGLDVYIQSHAINRMQERLDGLPIQMCILNLFISIATNPVVLLRDADLLIEYRIEGLKIGYVVATRQKDTIVIRTFLFLTFNGTPEGRKLSDITGLGKLDKRYLAIDKLSTFLSSDILQNPVVADIFSRAGCSDLLHTEKILNYVNTKLESTFSSKVLLKYLNLLEPSLKIDEPDEATANSLNDKKV